LRLSDFALFEYLLEQGLTDESTLLKAWSTCSGIPFLETSLFPDPDLVQRYTFSEYSYSYLPLYSEANGIAFVTHNPFCLFEVTPSLNQGIELILFMAPRSEIERFKKTPSYSLSQ